MAEGDVDGSDDPLEPFSPLYRLHNGFMLGLFGGSSLFFHARKQNKRHREVVARISEFLLELGEDGDVHPDLDHDLGFEDAVEAAIRRVDPPVADFFLLGLAVFRCAILPDRDDGSVEQDIDEVCARLEALGHASGFFREEFEAYRNRGSEERSWQEMMTWGLGVERQLVTELSPEPDTCFVAMPFRAPFEERYLNFYRRAVLRIGLRTIRAWGELGKEQHQELLMALIAKSGALLGEVSEPNPNVMFEVGFALGGNKDTYLVAEADVWQSTANIQMDWVYPYETATSEHEHWEIPAAWKAGLYFTTLKAARRADGIPSWQIRPLKALELLAQLFQEGKDEDEPDSESDDWAAGVYD